MLYDECSFHRNSCAVVSSDDTERKTMLCFAIMIVLATGDHVTSNHLFVLYLFPLAQSSSMQILLCFMFNSCGERFMIMDGFFE